MPAQTLCPWVFQILDPLGPLARKIFANGLQPNFELSQKFWKGEAGILARFFRKNAKLANIGVNGWQPGLVGKEQSSAARGHEFIIRLLLDGQWS